MRYASGWIKLHRKVFLTEIFEDPHLFHLFCYLLMTANYEESTVKFAGKPYRLFPGENLISTHKVASKLRTSQSSVVRRLEYLEMREFLTQKVTHRGRIITICNWYEYQERRLSHDSNSDSDVTQSRLSPDSVLTQQKELKNPRREEEKKKESEPFAEPPNGSLGVASSDPPLIISKPPKRIRKPKEPKPITDGSRVWASYAEAYTQRYGTPPVRNAKTNSLCAALVQHLGAEEAPQVAAFYVTHADSFIVRQLHPLGLLINGSQRFRTEWAVGRQMTGTVAAQIDKNQTNNDVIARAIQRTLERERKVNNEV